MASLEPKLFCSVAGSEWFRSRRTPAGRFSSPVKALTPQ